MMNEAGTLLITFPTINAVDMPVTRIGESHAAS
jgi:hypothetical protein